MVTTDTDAIIAAIETELAAEWYSHAAAERRAQRDNVRAASIIPRLPRSATGATSRWLCASGRCSRRRWCGACGCWGES